jgi:hypothetical protein
MSQKLSLKLLRQIVSGAESGSITYEAIVEQLDKHQTAYNELMLQGMIQESLDKGAFVRSAGEAIIDGTFGPKPRQSTGGGTPTRMYKLKNPLKPENGEFTEKAYDKEAVESDPVWATTKLAAVKAAKSHFYQTVYWPALEQYRKLEEELSPAKPQAEATDEAA